MITEDYVSFEVAKLLKEKGFDEPCHKCYYTPTKEQDEVYNGTNSGLDSNFISCPTLQMAMKWLREEHNIDINVDYKRCDMNVYSVDIVTKNGTKFIRNWNTYEQACEAALKYTLENLI